MEFSIIVPVYNGERHLSSCIDTVFRQNFSDFELIFVDDGSTDQSAALCDEAARENARIRVVHQKNAGQLFARLNGAAAAKGEYCIFLDADDSLEPECLATLDQAIRRYDRPDLLIYSFQYEDPDGSLRPASLPYGEDKVFDRENKTELYSLFFQGTLLNNVWTKAVKREVFSRPHPDYSRFSALRCGEDRVQSMVMASDAESVVFLPARLYRYRLLAGSVTRQFSPDAVGRFDTKAAYPFELECLQAWGMRSRETVLRLNASYLSQALYVLDLFYHKIDGEDGRLALLSYPWRTLVPEPCLADYQDNPFLNETQKAVLALVLRGDADGLKKHFRQKDRIKKLRAIKHRLLG